MAPELLNGLKIVAVMLCTVGLMAGLAVYQRRRSPHPEWVRKLMHLGPETTLIAEQSESPVALAFSVPDLAQAQRGEIVDALIIKTVAVRPEVSGLGLGTLLAARVHEAAAALGFRHVIHALMHETNRSRKISSHYARTMRRYTLFSRPLARG